ncbi:hypothetical protein [Clostridium kluyveri]|uniref:Right handed beta helix domain-containing protein n=1 Tax=Clostridium kluyveri TaxID=1534 RepID=A0A1L5F8T5_CLOKL|nr:hypothetical protein [Clostridium kluyveri]APM39387.1 hypothetical protein BS101_11865 [Clostridium kluyveri]
MSIDVSQRVAQIRTAEYGKDVRENLAGGIEDIADDVNDFETTSTQQQAQFEVSINSRQTNLENVFNQEIANQSVENPSNMETVAARTDNVNNTTYNTIGQRLDNQASHLADVVLVTWFGAKCDGITDNTIAFKNAFATGKEVIIPNTNPDSFYKISEVLIITNNVVGVGLPKIKMFPVNPQDTVNNAGKSQIFRAVNQINSKIKISGTYCIGNWDGISTITEHSHIIAVCASDNVEICNNIFETPQGDCVYVGAYTFDDTIKIKNTSDNPNIHDNIFINPYRCSVALVSSENPKIKDNQISKNNTFVSAIDIEPNNNDGTYIKNIEIENNIFNINNVITSILIVNKSANSIKDVKIKSNTFNTTGYGIRASDQSSNANLGNVEIYDNKYNGNNISSGFININCISDFIDIKNNKDIGIGATWFITQSNNINVEQNTWKSLDGVTDRLNWLLIGESPIIRVSKNDIYNCDNIDGALRIVGYDTTITKNVDITENNFYNVKRAIGIDNRTDNTLFQIEKLQIVDNSIDNYFDGIHLACNILDLIIKNQYKGIGVPVEYNSFFSYGTIASPEFYNISNDIYATAMPTSGTYTKGQVVKNINPVETGTSGNMYIVFGWICITGGTPGTWRALKILTGN